MRAGSRSKGRQDTNIVSATAFVEELYVMLANAAQVHMIRRVGSHLSGASDACRTWGAGGLPEG